MPGTGRVTNYKGQESCFCHSSRKADMGKELSLKGGDISIVQGVKKDKLLGQFQKEASSLPVQDVRDFLEELVFKPDLER